MDFDEKGITSFHSDNSVVTRHSCRDNFEKGMNFNYDSFLLCTLLMLKCVNVVFNAKKLMLCGDVELNPGPANYQKHRSSIGGFYTIAKKLSSHKCLQQILCLNSADFYFWKKVNLSGPFVKKTNLKDRNLLK